MQRRRDFRLVVLDWDGTVMDSSSTIVACMRRSIEDVGLASPEDEVLRDAIGLALDVMLAQILPDQPIEVRCQVIDHYRQHWIGHFRHRPQPYEGVRDAISTLRQRDVWLAVATGKGRVGLDRDLDHTGLRPYFLTTRTVDEAPSKPTPHMLLALMDELGVQRTDTLRVGDTTYDLEMAHHAGVASVGVLCGSHDRTTLERWCPLACLETLADLPGWLVD